MAIIILSWTIANKTILYRCRVVNKPAIPASFIEVDFATTLDIVRIYCPRARYERRLGGFTTGPVDTVRQKYNVTAGINYARRIKYPAYTVLQFV